MERVAIKNTTVIFFREILRPHVLRYFFSQCKMTHLTVRNRI